jgi:SEC-C motif-containing protein
MHMHSALCPCHSGKSYSVCCKPYHTGKLPEHALALMRSRYSAYALQLTDYIMQTTHPQNPVYSSDRRLWKKEIHSHYKETDFYGLKIVDFIDGSQEAYVTFTAFLKQASHDFSFTERSRFLKVNGKWLYESGEKLPIIF